MRKQWLVIIGWISLILVQPIQAQTLPQRPQGFISDFAGVIPDIEERQLEQRLTSLEQQTTVEMAVVTTNDLQETTIEEYAVKLFERWQIGKKGKDNGLLLLIAPQDRVVRIEVGYGLEPVVTDAESAWIIKDTLTPAFREEKYAVGIDGAVSRIEQLVSNQATPRTDQPQAEPEGVGVGMIFAIFFGLQFLYSVLASTRSWWLGGVLGGVSGLVIGLIFGFFFMGILALLILIPLGLVIDYMLSKRGMTLGPSRYGSPGMWGQGGSWGGFGGGRSGGFGGFGGGRSGGGGATGRW